MFNRYGYRGYVLDYRKNEHWTFKTCLLLEIQPSAFLSGAPFTNFTETGCGLAFHNLGLKFGIRVASDAGKQIR